MVSSNSTTGSTNPFSIQRNKAPKFSVINRKIKGSQRDMSSATSSRSTNRDGLRKEFGRRKNVNVVNDRRFGQNDESVTVEEKMMERFVKERQRGMKSGGRGKRFMLDGEDDNDHSSSKKRSKKDKGMGGGLVLTHKGSAITEDTIKNDPFNNSDSDDDKDPYKALDKVDTALHFGGGKLAKMNENPYGSYGAGGDTGNLGDMYRSRKNELDDVIKMR